MGELLPEFWSVPKDEDSVKSAAPARRLWKLTNIFLWLQCYATYASVLGPQFPEAIPELLAYMASIIRVSQDYRGLAWVRYVQKAGSTDGQLQVVTNQCRHLYHVLHGKCPGVLAL